MKLSPALIKAAVQAHQNRYSKCVSCTLGKVSKVRIYHRGTIPCDVLFVGEAPGDTEIALGEPFLGPAGKLLDHLIDEALHSHLTYCLTNAVICPPQDSPCSKLRTPKKSEITACSRRLQHFIDICSPRYLIALGRIAETSLKKLELPYHYIPHPSSILRQEEQGNLDYARARTVLQSLGP